MHKGTESRRRVGGAVGASGRERVTFDLILSQRSFLERNERKRELERGSGIPRPALPTHFHAALSCSPARSRSVHPPPASRLPPAPLLPASRPLLHPSGSLPPIPRLWFLPCLSQKTPVPPCQGQLPRAFKPQNCSARPIRVSSPSHVRGSRGTERSRNLPEVTQFTGGRSPPKAETRNQSPQVAQHLDLNSGLLTLRSDFFPLHPTHSAHRLRPFC